VACLSDAFAERLGTSAQYPGRLPPDLTQVGVFHPTSFSHAVAGTPGSNRVKEIPVYRRLLLLPILLSLWLGPACSSDTATAPPTTASPANGAVAGQVRAQLSIDFTGAPQQRAKVTQPLSVAPGTKAWDAIRTSLGESNISTQNFGGDLGILITGFYGVQAQGNHFWEFLVNGKQSDTGVSSYVLKEGDNLEFRYSSF
jgi:hypothetical protein